MRQGLSYGIALAVVIGVACSTAHTGESDGGASDSGHGGASDSGHDGAAVVDGSLVQVNSELGQCTEEDLATCGCIGGFRRCDTCDAACPLGSACRTVVQVCRERDLPTSDEGCTFSKDPVNSIQHYCAVGMPCAVGAGVEGTEEDPFFGNCMPVEYCLAAQTADPPLAEPVKCVYADGSELVSGPPPDECPASESDPRLPWCGGACGRSHMCPEHPHGFDFNYVAGPCVGLSDERGFGVCTFSRNRCLRNPEVVQGWTTNELLLRECETRLDEPCVCLVTDDQPVPDGEEHGFAMPASICQTYREHHAGSVTCRTADWQEIE